MAEVAVRGVKRTVTISVKPPHIYIQKKLPGRGLVNTEDPNQEYRLLFHWLKSKIEAITWGLTSIEREFLSEITTALPDGRTTSIGEVVQDLIADDRLPSLPFFGESRSPTNDELRQAKSAAKTPRIIDVGSG